MLFHVTLRHSSVDCPGRNPGNARASRVHFAEPPLWTLDIGSTSILWILYWLLTLKYSALDLQPSSEIF